MSRAKVRHTEKSQVEEETDKGPEKNDNKGPEKHDSLPPRPTTVSHENPVTPPHRIGILELPKTPTRGRRQGRWATSSPSRENDDDEPLRGRTRTRDGLADIDPSSGDIRSPSGGVRLPLRLDDETSTDDSTKGTVHKSSEDEEDDDEEFWDTVSAIYDAKNDCWVPIAGKPGKA